MVDSETPSRDRVRGTRHDPVLSLSAVTGSCVEQVREEEEVAVTGAAHDY